MSRRLRGLALRLTAVIAVTLVIMFAPRPDSWPPWAGPVQAGVAVTVLVFSLGKLLYDTLFYNRYWP